jgi:hypothetical protein
MRTFKYYLSCIALWVVTIPVFSDTVEEILSSSSTPPFTDRHHKLHALTEADIVQNKERLFKFLAVSDVPPNMAANDFLSLKNDIADFLITYDLKTDEHLKAALNVIKDPQESFVWRDYYIQKLPAMLQASQILNQSAERALALIERLAAQEVPGLTGTALIAAYSLTETSEIKLKVTPQKLSVLAYNCASNVDAPLIDRITALQIAAILKKPEAFDLAKIYIINPQNNEIPIMLKVSALGALRYSENPDYLPIVSSYRLSPDIRLRAAARGTIEELSK